MTETRNESGSPFRQRLGRFLRFLVRLLFVVVIGTLIGLGLYYGAPWLYRRVVLPVQENSARIAVVEARLELQQQRISENHRALQDRAANLEADLAELQESTSVQIQGQQLLEEQTERLAQRLATTESELELREGESLELERSLEAATSDLRAQVDSVEKQLAETRADIGMQIEATEARVTAAEEQAETLTGRLVLLQTAQDLLKVRLLLLEENPGAARDTLGLAVAHLDRALAVMTEQTEDLENLRERMLALDDLIAERSFRVGPTLESLWADVMELVVPPANQSGVTTTQTPPPPLPTPSPSP